MNANESNSGDAAPVRLPKLDHRIPVWDKRSLEDRQCPFCDQVGVPTWERPDGLIAVRCLECGGTYVSPAPTEEALSVLYESYFAAHSSLTRPTPTWERSLRRASPLLDVRILELASMMDFQGARVLDIGCGRGEFLFRARQLGASCVGTELDPSAASIARDRLGLDEVRVGTVATVPMSERFDLVTLNDVIEHPLDPLGLVMQATERLDRGGLLALWTPLAPSDPTSQPTALRVDLEHMQYLSERTVGLLARRFDLEIAHLETIGHADLDTISVSAPSIATRVRQGLLSRLRSATGRVPLARIPFETRQAMMRTGSYNLFAVLRRPT